MKSASRRVWIASIGVTVIAISAGLVIADGKPNTAPVVANASFSDEQAQPYSGGAQGFSSFYGGEYTLAEHLQGR